MLLAAILLSEIPSSIAIPSGIAFPSRIAFPSAPSERSQARVQKPSDAPISMRRGAPAEVAVPKYRDN
jgi:hypothetical protein